jgi:hypothetical protein
MNSRAQRSVIRMFHPDPLGGARSMPAVVRVAMLADQRKVVLRSNCGHTHGDFS